MDGKPLPKFIGHRDKYDAYERNEIFCDEFFSHLANKLAFKGDLKAAWNSLIGEAVEVVDPFLQSLPPFLRLVALSNTNRCHLNHIKDRFEFLNRFERVIGSYEIGYRKPQAEAFLFVLELLNLQAEEVLFLDGSL